MTVEQAVASSVGRKMSNGCAAPAAARREMTVVGSICKLDALITRNIHIASLARSPTEEMLFISFMASNPAGVAALPSPSMFAARLTATACSARSFPRTPGNRRIAGRRARDRRRINPVSSRISIKPHQSAYAPAREMHSATASPHADNTASVMPAPSPPAMPTPMHAHINRSQTRFTNVPPSLDP